MTLYGTMEMRDQGVIVLTNLITAGRLVLTRIMPMRNAVIDG